MKVLITSSKGKDKLVGAFEKEGAELVKSLSDNPQLIIPTVDEELPFFSLSKDWFLQKGIRVMVSDEFTVSTCRDKAEFGLFCGRHSIPTPRTRQIGGSILKPRFGKGSKGITYINNSYVLQDEITWGREYSVDYLGDWQGKPVSVVPRVRLEVVNGESHAAEIDLNPALIEAATKLGTELKLMGHNTLQCFFDGQTVSWTEVNCRFGGGFWLSQDTFNTVRWILNNAHA